MSLIFDEYSKAGGRYDISTCPAIQKDAILECHVAGEIYTGKFIQLLGDDFQGDVLEVEIDCGLTTTRIFPQKCIKKINGEEVTF